MNERILELKHLAEVWCFENIPEQFSEETGYGEAWEDKFAELIIKECAGLVQGVPIDTMGYQSADQKIKQHFGVEE